MNPASIPIKYVQSGAPDDRSNGITPQRYREFLDTCYKKYKAYEEAGAETYFNRKDHLITLYEYEEGIFQIPEDADPEMIYEGCNCADCHITILPTGDVYACRRVAESKVGKNAGKDESGNHRKTDKGRRDCIIGV